MVNKPLVADAEILWEQEIDVKRERRRRRVEGENEGVDVVSLGRCSEGGSSAWTRCSALSGTATGEESKNRSRHPADVAQFVQPLIGKPPRTSLTLTSYYGIRAEAQQLCQYIISS